MQALERLTFDKIQDLEGPTNKNQKNTQTQTEEFRAQLITLLRQETEERWPKIIRTPTLNHTITIQELSPDDRHPNQKITEILQICQI